MVCENIANFYWLIILIDVDPNEDIPALSTRLLTSIRTHVSMLAKE